MSINDGWNAAKAGNLGLLKHLHSRYCKWDKRTCENAASGGHLEALKCLHENGCS